MIRWFANSKAKRGYAKLGKEDAEFDLFTIVALLEFWLIAAGLVMVFVLPWVGAGLLVLAVLLAVLAFMVS